MRPDSQAIPYPMPGQPLSVDEEARVFWGLRGRLMRASVERMLTTARLRVTLVGVLGLLFWASLFFLFYSGF